MRAALLVALVLPSAALAGPAPFAKIAGNPIGIACVADGPGGVQDKLIVTSYNPGNLHIVHEDGSVETLFPDGFPRNWSSIESYLAISTGLGGWPIGQVYASFGPTIFRFSEDLSSVTKFVTVPGKPGTHTGITFDRTGKWGFDMVLTFVDGTVYRVDSAGNATYVANVHHHHESPRVIPDDPDKWGELAGCATTSSEAAHKVFAICPDGATRVLAEGVLHAETSDVRPMKGEVSFGDSGNVFFASRHTSGTIWGWPAESFPKGSQGDLFVSREFAGGITRIDGVGHATEFEAPLGQHYEGSNFCFRPESIDVGGSCAPGVPDTTPPTAVCNAPATLSPPEAPMAFKALGSDNCGAPKVVLSDLSCYRTPGSVGRIDADDAKRLDGSHCGGWLEGDTLHLKASVGVGNHYVWYATAHDASGNSAPVKCELEIVAPPSSTTDAARGTTRSR